MNTIQKLLVLILVWTGASYAQIKWEHITGSPYSIGTTAPVTCTIGDVFFKTNATAGQNVYGCTATNTWTLVSSDVTSLIAGLDGKADTTHVHNASTDLASGEVPAARGGLAADASAYTGFLRMMAGVSSASEIVTADLPAVIDFSAKTSTAPAKIGTLAPVTCSVGDVFFDTDATAGENWLLCTAVNTWTAVIGSGSSVATTYSVVSFTAPFTSATSVVLTHNFGSTKQIVACYDGSSVYLEPSSITIGGPSTTVTFANAQTGSCTVIGGTGLYEESFTAQTSVNLDHDYNTTSIIVKCYGLDEIEVQPSSITATDVNNATVTFVNAQSGRCTVAAMLAVTGGGGGSGTVTSVAVNGISGIIDVSGSPVTTSGTIALSLANQTSYKFLGTGASTAAPSFQAIPAAALPAMVGDSGSGGVQGVVPAPTAGDAAALKFLKADGTWAVPAGGGGGTGDVTNIIGTATISSWGTLAAHSCTDKNLTVTGAVSGDNVAPGWPSTLEAGIMGAMIPGTDVVVVRLCNVTATGVAVTDGKTFKAMVLRSTI